MILFMVAVCITGCQDEAVEQVSPVAEIHQEKTVETVHISVKAEADQPVKIIVEKPKKVIAKPVEKKVNNWDRKSGAAVGVYRGSVKANVHDYPRPQENGNKTDVRWATITNNNGKGLLAVGMPLLSVSAWPYSMADLEKATHTNKLPDRDFVTVNLDYKQMGIAGDNSWGARPNKVTVHGFPGISFGYAVPA